METIGLSQYDQFMLLSGEKHDGYVMVTVSEDRLTLKADFFPPSATGGRPLDAENISYALARSSISSGIIWENIHQAINECNINNYPQREVIIARGSPPVSEILEYFQMNPKLKPVELAPKGNERLDYRELSPFIIVKKDQRLAKRKSRKEGVLGRDIYGQEIPYGTVKPTGVSGGENTRSDDQFIYADIDGQLIENKGTLNIQENLVIKGAVDYRTGNIIFPGDVVIEGPVSDGFKIYSGGSLTIKQTFDVTEVTTKTDLIVAGGIIGRGRGLIKVGGELKTKFIENCKSASRKSVTVDTEIINSSIYTMEKLEMNEKGMIIGSEIYAVQGIHVGSIGKKSGKASKIHCGVDFTAQQEQEKYNTQLQIIAAKLKKIRELLEADRSEYPEPVPDSPEAERRKKMEDLHEKLVSEQNKCSSKAGAVLARLNANEDATVEAIGEIASGTLIEICQVALFVSAPLRNVRIRLDRSKGKLITESLKSQPAAAAKS